MRLEKFNEFIEKATRIAKGQDIDKVNGILILTQEYNINVNKKQIMKFIEDVR